MRKKVNRKPVNTKSSLPKATVQQYIIDPEFENLLPRKTQEQYEVLKNTIRNDKGVRDPFVVWDTENILLDGHHRDRICKELKIKPPIIRMSFASREDAKMWVIQTQLARRNLNTFQSIEVALKFKDIFSAKAKANQRAAGGAVRLKSTKPVVAVEEVAKLAGVGSDTVKKVEKILAKASDPAVAKTIESLRNGDAHISIHSVYQEYCVTKKSAPSASSNKPRIDKAHDKQSVITTGKLLAPHVPPAKPLNHSKLPDEKLGDRDKTAVTSDQDIVPDIDDHTKEVQEDLPEKSAKVILIERVVNELSTALELPQQDGQRQKAMLEVFKMIFKDGFTDDVVGKACRFRMDFKRLLKEWIK